MENKGAASLWHSDCYHLSKIFMVLELDNLLLDNETVLEGGNKIIFVSKLAQN